LPEFPARPRPHRRSPQHPRPTLRRPCAAALAGAASLALLGACASTEDADRTAIATLREALIAAQAGDLDRADELAARAESDRPGFIDPLFARAAIAEQRRDLESARTFYTRILQIDPSRTPAGTALAQTYIAEGRFDEGTEWLRRSIEADPGAEAAMFNMGVLAEQRGELEPATAWFRLSAILEIGDPRPVTAIARIRVRQGRTAEARAAAEEALRRAPGFGPATALLASIPPTTAP
jgi:tetratricopeptide (TPR) repeat protein